MIWNFKFQLLKAVFLKAFLLPGPSFIQNFAKVPIRMSGQQKIRP